MKKFLFHHRGGKDNAVSNCVQKCTHIKEEEGMVKVDEEGAEVEQMTEDEGDEKNRE